VELAVSARGTFRMALSGAAVPVAAAVIAAARGIPCHPPQPILDVITLALEMGGLILLGAAFAFETLRQRLTPLEERRADQMMTLALLGLSGIALAAFLIANRLTAC